MSAPKKSEGHLCFGPDTHDGQWEFYTAGEHIYRASTIAPVMPDGRRGGRWYCPLWQWERDKAKAV